MCKGQVVAEYSGPQMPLELCTRGEYVLHVPTSEIAIDGNLDNCPGGTGQWPRAPAIYANHSSRPNIVLHHCPASADTPDHMLLVALEPVAAGHELRFNYEDGAKPGAYWGRSRPRETRWRRLCVRPPPPSGEPPIVFHGAALTQWAIAQLAQEGTALLRSHLAVPTPWESGGDSTLRRLLESLRESRWY